jgi:hypothetical protein
MATSAVFLALGGTSYAAVSLSDGQVQTRNLADAAVRNSKIASRSVTGNKIKAGAITTSKVRDGSLLAKDFLPGQLPAGGAAGEPGARGEKGEAGPSGKQGATGTDGKAGEAGASGAKGETGSAGPKGDTGATGATGPQGAAGAKGDTGAPGAQGDVGDQGDPGPVGPRGTVLDYAEFYALAPPDNAATVPQGSAVEFPRDGPTSGAIGRIGQDSFVLPAAGTYRVSFAVPVGEAGQLQLTLNGAALGYTVAGRAAGSSPIAGSALVRTTISDSVLQVVNFSSSTALTVTPFAGGNSPSASTLIVERLD